MFELFPPTDRKQELRMRRFLMAVASSFLVVFLLALIYSMSLITLPLLLEATAIIFLLIVLAYAVFRSGLNRHFPDPSLTMEQIILASMTLIFVMYQSWRVRSVLIVAYPIPFMFGVFALDRARLLLLALLLLLAYAGMVLLSAYTKPDNADIAVEVMQFVALCVVLPWIATLGGYFQRLRMSLRQNRNELQQALEKLKLANQALQDSHAELDHLASTDKLTGAWNRRRLDEAVASEMERLIRHAHPVSLLVLDIDYFKKVNDRYGHSAGDQLLVELAAQIKSTLRIEDSLTRWGGEEFVVLCPNTALSAAAIFAERLRNTIAGLNFLAAIKITVSIGVAECLPGETWEGWFQRADASLFRAKDSGRNQVQIASETPVLPSAITANSGDFFI